MRIIQLGPKCDTEQNVLDEITVKGYRPATKDELREYISNNVISEVRCDIVALGTFLDPEYSCRKYPVFTKNQFDTTKIVDISLDFDWRSNPDRHFYRFLVVEIK
ncbi:MAG: hypothetical protein AAB870_01755 [Patescibacteria group bacterium]